MVGYLSEEQIQDQPGYRPSGRWAVVNASVTQVLGRYDTAENAQGAATELGQASFAYELSDAEVVALDHLHRLREPQEQRRPADQDTQAALRAQATAAAQGFAAEEPGISEDWTR